jgi:hypothetical protein
MPSKAIGTDGFDYLCLLLSQEPTYQPLGSILVFSQL